MTEQPKYQSLKVPKPEPMPCSYRNNCPNYEPAICINRDFVDVCRRRIKEDMERSYL